MEHLLLLEVQGHHLQEERQASITLPTINTAGMLIHPLHSLMGNIPLQFRGQILREMHILLRQALPIP